MHPSKKPLECVSETLFWFNPADHLLNQLKGVLPAEFFP